MRRNDREVKTRREILDILNRCDAVSLGINAPDYPYVVPMNFGAEYEAGNDSVILWLHCAHEGLKLGLIAENPRVGFEADCSRKIITGETACNYTMEYESVIGGGNISVCSRAEDKIRGLEIIMRHYEPEKEFDFPERALAAVCILRLDVVNITGKRLKR